MKKNLINTLNIENKELWCLEKTLRYDRQFGDEDNIPWAIFISLALEQNITLSDSWGIFWPCKIGVNVNGSTLLTSPAQFLNDAQKSSLLTILERNNAEPIFIDGIDFFLIRFREQNLEFNTFLPTVGQIYLKPVLSNDKRGRRWLEVLTEIEMEWHKEGLSESINSLWAWSINPAKYDMPAKKIRNTNAYNCELNSAQELAVYGVKKFADHFLQTSYDIISIPEHSVLTKNLHVKHIRSARALFLTNSIVSICSQILIFIYLEKEMGYITLKPLKIYETYRQNVTTLTIVLAKYLIQFFIHLNDYQPVFC